jgi:hypothetical protein
MLKDPTGRILPIIAGVIVGRAVRGAAVSAAAYGITSAITGDFSYGGSTITFIFICSLISNCRSCRSSHIRCYYRSFKCIEIWYARDFTNIYANYIVTIE